MRRAFLGLLIICAACQYQPDGEAFKTLQQPSSVALSIDLVGYAASTIPLTQKTTFNYIFNTDGRPITEAKIIFNSFVIVESIQSRGSFTIDPAGWPAGNYELLMFFKSPTNSGSIAEKSGYEIFNITSSRTIVITK